MDVIAERHLELRIDASPIPVTVKLGRPRIDASGESWICDYEVWFGDTCRSMAIHGADTMQALQLAIATLDGELTRGARKLKGSLYHYDEPFVSIVEGGCLRVVSVS